MNKILTTSIIATLMISSVVIADDIVLSDVEAQYSAKSTVDAGDKLKQSINLGFSNTTGNTDTLTLNGKYDMSFTTIGYDKQKLKVGFNISAFINKTNDDISNEEYTANLGLEQYISENWLGYASINWLRNPDFKNLDNKLSVGIGIGRELFNDGQHSLKAKLGVAYNIQQYADTTEDAKFTSINEYLEYVNILNKTSTLFIKVGASENFDDFKNDYEVMTSAGFNFSVAENLSVTIEEEVLYDKVHPGTEKSTDTKSIVRIGYNF